MPRVTHLGVQSFARFQAALLALVGGVAGIVYSVGGLVIDAMVSLGWVSPAVASTSGLSIGTLLAFGALVGMPLLFGLFGFVLGYVEALLYAVFARRFTALSLDIQSP